jgi:hypothetical protein
MEIEDWNVVIIAAYSFPVLVVLVVLIPALARATFRRLRR